MTRLRFLADEDIPGELISALLRQEPGMDILAVGQPGAPPKGTLDPDLLLAAESFGLIWHATTADEWLDQTDYIPY